MTLNQKQILNWGTAFAIFISFTILCIAVPMKIERPWLIPMIIMVIWTSYVSWFISPRLCLFLAYHAVVFTIAYLFVVFVLGPAFNIKWVWWLEWLRLGVRALFKAILGTLAVASMLSCFDFKRLKPTQIGQGSIGGWVTEALKNQKNWLFGWFTGLPSVFVQVKAFDGTARTITKTLEIQTEIDGDPNGGKFQAVVKIRFKTQIKETFIHINNPHTDDTLFLIADQSLTAWLNLSTNRYTGVTSLKAHKDKIQEFMGAVMDGVKAEFGDEITEFNVVDIEEPDAIIKQRIIDAAEMENVEAMNRQVRKIIEEAQAHGETITRDQAVEQLFLEHERVEKIIGSGRARFLHMHNDVP